MKKKFYDFCMTSSRTDSEIVSPTGISSAVRLENKRRTRGLFKAKQPLNCLLPPIDHCLGYSSDFLIAAVRIFSL
jgi:hypothetical protein